MRRVLTALSEGRDTSEVSTLANPEVVETIRHRIADERPNA